MLQNHSPNGNNMSDDKQPTHSLRIPAITGPYAQMVCDVDGFWSTPIRVIANRTPHMQSKAWTFQVSHSSGGTNGGCQDECLQQYRNFATAIVDICDRIDDGSLAEELEGLYKAHQESVRTRNAHLAS